MGSDEGAGSRDETVTGTVERIVFVSDDGGWSVLRLRSPRGGVFTAVGPLIGAREGDELRLTGRWENHARFGERFQVEVYLPVLPTTLDGLRRYLASGRVRGLGPATASRMVDHFGLEALSVLDHEPERLMEVHGIGPRLTARIRESWRQQRGVQQVMIFLAGHGVAPGVANRAYRRFGAATLDVLRENPYRLAEEVHGVGFLTADRIARGLGLAADAPERLQAGLAYSLDRAALDGHVFVPRASLLDAARGLLELEPDRKETLAAALDALIARGSARQRSETDKGSLVLLPRLDAAEAAVATRVREMLAEQTAPAGGRIPPEIDAFERRAGLELAPLQRAAVETALGAALTVVTGGPGTGKTTLVRCLVELAHRAGGEILLAAPTGRAAKRLGEATAHGARTLHRLLEFNPKTGEFGRNRHHALEADLVVVDEASMLDVELAARLFEAVPPGTRLVLVGDADQLPSVGPGNVLGDLIASARLAVIRLDRIFRQAEQSLIVRNAHRINRGEMPLEHTGGELGDFYFVPRDDPEAAARLAVEMASRRIPDRFGLDPVLEVQVLSPMHRGELGVGALNEALREMLTPAGPELRLGARSFRPGDKVMQVRNNYDLDIFNGDIGRVVAVDPEERELTALFDDRPLLLSDDDLDDLVPAYACTIHKAQGSEYPAVVVVLHHQHHIMLERNLLYTAVTRGRRLVVVIGSRRALRRAVTTATVRQRNTLLAARITADR